MFVRFVLELSTMWVAIVVCQINNNYPSVPCLKVDYRESRIVGGVNTEMGETPYIVSLTRRGGHFCGATVLNERWLLTAGHCVCNYFSGLNRIIKPTQIKAIFGLYQISEFKDNTIETNAFEVDLETIIPHEQYECTKPANDIALIMLHKPIQFSDYVKATCISLSDVGNMAGETAVVSGWGWTNEDQSIGQRADILQKAVVSIWDNKQCQKSYRDNEQKHEILSTQLCAGHVSGGIDSCWADSGGPLISNGSILIGVVSTGVGCARPGLPGIYTRVSEYVEWIQNTIQRN